MTGAFNTREREQDNKGGRVTRFVVAQEGHDTQSSSTSVVQQAALYKWKGGTTGSCGTSE